ncbi:hypothetical protein M0Q28_06585 [Patescibacteria group bacterium]|jgi:hypothetical protein|nr:hypothetical protein [Patescibacteria group bacterium]
MFTSVDKALAAIVMGLAFLLNSWFHISVPGWLTPDSINQVLAVLTPLVVYLIPNKKV